MTVSLTTFRDRLPMRAATHATPPIPAPHSHDACQIDLLADRVPSLRTGSTHKVYRNWHFDVVCRTDDDPAGSTRFTVPIAPGPWALGGSRYALTLQPGQGTIAVGDAARFTWGTTIAGTTNPLSVAYDQARQWLQATRLQRDEAPSEQYRESPPTARTGLDTWEDEGGSSATQGARQD
jgi:hypothetical protein